MTETAEHALPTQQTVLGLQVVGPTAQEAPASPEQSAAHVPPSIQTEP